MQEPMDVSPGLTANLPDQASPARASSLAASSLPSTPTHRMALAEQFEMLSGGGLSPMRAMHMSADNASVSDAGELAVPPAAPGGQLRTRCQPYPKPSRSIWGRRLPGPPAVCAHPSHPHPHCLSPRLRQRRMMNLIFFTLT